MIYFYNYQLAPPFMGVGEEGDLVLCYSYKMFNLDSTSFDIILNSKNLLTQRKHSGECNIL